MAAAADPPFVRTVEPAARSRPQCRPHGARSGRSFRALYPSGSRRIRAPLWRFHGEEADLAVSRETLLARTSANAAP